MFFERMDSLMKELEISRNKLSTDLKIGKNQIKYWETKGNVPNALTLKAISDYLNTTPEYLLGTTDIKEKPSEESEGLSEKKKHIISLYDSLTEEQQALVDQYIDLIHKTKE